MVTSQWYWCRENVEGSQRRNQGGSQQKVMKCNDGQSTEVLSILLFINVYQQVTIEELFSIDDQSIWRGSVLMTEWSQIIDHLMTNPSDDIIINYWKQSHYWKWNLTDRWRKLWYWNPMIEGILLLINKINDYWYEVLLTNDRVKYWKLNIVNILLY